MPQARLTYFSGTGNTRWVAERLGFGLSSAGYDIVASEIGRRTESARRGRLLRPGPAQDVELDVFLFPVYAFALPHIVRRFYKKLPRVPMKPASLVAVVGEMYVGRPGRRRRLPGYEGGALVEARRMLERRGYIVFSSHVVGLPVSYTQVAAAPPPEEQAQILARAEQTIAAMARTMARKEGSHLPYARAHWLWNVPVRILFRRLARRFSGKLYVADARCIGCGWCARHCPAAAIRLRGGRPRWGWRCESCQRCINGCPQSAIQTSVARTLFVTAATVLPYDRVFGLDALWGRLGFLGEWGSRAFWVGSWLVCAVLAVLLVDALLFLAEKPLALRKLLAASYTSRYVRYREPLERPKGTRS